MHHNQVEFILRCKDCSTYANQSMWYITLLLLLLSCFSPVWLFVTLWTIALQVSLFVGFSRQEYWSGLPCPPPGDLPDTGIELIFPASPALQEMNSLPLSHRESQVWYLLLVILYKTKHSQVLCYYKPVRPSPECHANHCTRLKVCSGPCWQGGFSRPVEMMPFPGRFCLLWRFTDIELQK